VQTIVELLPGQVVAVDGKTVRRSHDRRAGKGPLHVVSAWAAGAHLVLGQTAVETKSNEITAIPEVLRQLDLHGCIVTIDAMGCQREIAAQIRTQGGDYLLAVKDNQPLLAQRVATLFAHAETPDGRHLERSEHVTVNKGHGRLEERHCLALTPKDWSFYLDPQERWEDLHTIIRVEASRQVAGVTTRNVRYYISSLEGEAAQAAGAIRAHWGIENSLHWVLDIAFREDESRLRQGDGAYNFGLLRRLALELLRREQSAKIGIKAKRRKAGWDGDYLLKVLMA
jgi:predicted transposase YbfD/YdcC